MSERIKDETQPWLKIGDTRPSFLGWYEVWDGKKWVKPEQPEKTEIPGGQ